MLLAHALGGGGPEIELLFAGVVVVIFAIIGMVQKTHSPLTTAVTGGVGLAMSIAAFVLAPGPPTKKAPPDVSIAITSPSEGDVVPAGEKVTVEVDLTNAELTTQTQSSDPRKGHIHIYVDDFVVAMPTELNAKIELEKGEHTLMAEFVAADHSRFDPPITDSVKVVAD